MGRIQPREIVLKSGETVVIRTAEPDDAPGFLELARTTYATTDFTVTLPDELDLDEPKQRTTLLDYLENPGRLALAAEHDGRVVGELTFKNYALRRMAHQGTFGIRVAEAWRGRGIGRAMIIELLDWAAATPMIEKVCLGVFAPNHRAIGLYRALGFVEQGRRAKEFKKGPGEYIDDIQMYLWVKPVEGETALWRANNTAHTDHRSESGAT